jgi:UDP-3-O-[3-hydroxymyristoyl] glucosamine N-acyltransferase
LALAMDPRYADGIGKGKARAAMLWPGADWRGDGAEGRDLCPARPVGDGWANADDGSRPAIIAPGIHPMTVVEPSARSGGAAIGPFVVIGAGVEIGPGARIASHVSIAEGARIGADALILQGARIGARVTIGDRFICQPGAVIGADGFSAL